MTTVEQTVYVDGAEVDALIVRTFEGEITADGDGRTLDVRVVPYNTPALVADPPDFREYEEVWLPGVFDRQARAANRINAWVNVEHEQGFRGIVGHGTALHEKADGLYGTFRVHETPDGDKALALVNEGVLTGVSLEAKAIKSQRDPLTGRVTRERAHLQSVALCRPGLPAFKEAEVLAVRTMPERITKPLVPPMDLERLAALGVAPIITRAVTRKPWDGSASRYTDEEYARACLIDRGGDAPVKERCSVPVLEPNGDLNVNALGPAAGALRGARTPLAGVSAEAKATAARKLARYYRLAGMDPPPGIVALGGK